LEENWDIAHGKRKKWVRPLVCESWKKGNRFGSVCMNIGKRKKGRHLLHGEKEGKSSHRYARVTH